MAKALYFFVLVHFAILPFFEGCESATGLFIAHSLTLVALGYCLVRSPRIWLPPLALWLPFLFYLILSCVLAPYKYSAFLRLWDWWVAALLALAWTTLMKEGESSMKQLGLYVFFLGTIALLLSLFFGHNPPGPRWFGTFANPNDFGTYAALLLIFGIFQLESVVSTAEKSMVWVALAFLAVCVAMAASRSVFLAIATASLLYLWQRKPPRWVIVSIAVFLAASGVILFSRLIHVDPFQYYRFRIWKHSLQGILHDPYFGVGLNMLPWKAAQFNFPADVEVGRYGMVATSADNQYLQILAETGFVGLLLFLTGWIGIAVVLKQIPGRFSVLRYSTFLAISIISVFSLPLQHTAIVSLFLFTILFPVTAADLPLRSLILRWPARIAGTAVVLSAFVFAVFLPYAAEREFQAAIRASAPEEALSDLNAATKLNPYQPYYLLAKIRPIVLSGRELSEEQWMRVLNGLQACIRLNPCEPDFYVYKAKVFRILHEKTGKEAYFGQAVEMYRRAEEQSPYQVFLRAELAYYLFSLKQYDLASKELTDILQMEPAYLNARLLLAEVKLRQGDRAGAQSELTELEQMEKRNAAQKASPSTAYIRTLLELNVQKQSELLRLVQ